jgi:hypothetical protein
MQAGDHVDHGAPGLFRALRVLHLREQLVVHGLPVEAAERRIEMPVADRLPDMLERIDIELSRLGRELGG